MRKIYVAGPMTGYEKFNFYEFDRVSSLLQAQGWNVINPANIDRANGFDPTIQGISHDLDSRDLGMMLSRDIIAISTCDAIFLMKGWEDSKGANMEKLFANIIGIDVYSFDENIPENYPNP